MLSLAIQNQVILVTGSTDGIGKQTGHDLVKMDVTLLLHGRNQERGETTLQKIYSATRNERLEYYLAGFSSLADVRHLVVVQVKYNSLNILFNNVGIS